MMQSSDQEIDDVLAKLKTGVAKGPRPVSYRTKQLKGLWRFLHENEEAIVDACKNDYGKPRFEALVTEVGSVKNDIKEMIDHVDEWSKPSCPSTVPALFRMQGVQVVRQAKGVVLVIGPWNFPVSLLLGPLAAALAAGNSVMIKPSELVPTVCQVLAERLPRYLDTEAVGLVFGGPQQTTEVLKRRFDHIFFTGSPMVGKIIYRAAAEHLTPVTLELGGSNPVFIGKTANIDQAAKAIAWAKWLNAGQLCLSANVVFCPAELEAKLVERLSHYFDMFSDASFKGQTKAAYSPGRMCNIVNKRNYERVLGCIDKRRGKVAYGGRHSAENNYIQPTILVDVSMEDGTMDDEIFGPVVPITRATPDQALVALRGKELPLALYIFSRDQKEIDRIIANTQSGGVCVNAIALHHSVPNVPFNGIGQSGTGFSHGLYSFETFSAIRTVFTPAGWFVKLAIGAMSAPYTESKIRSIRGQLGMNKDLYVESTWNSLSHGLKATISWGIALISLGSANPIDAACRWFMLYALYSYYGLAPYLRSLWQL